MERLKYIGILGFFAVVIIVMTWPLVPSFSMGIPGDGEDASLFIWNFWWFNFSIKTLHNNPFSSNYIFNPLGTSLIFHTFTPIYAALSLVFSIFTENYILQYNTFFFLTYFLTSWFMYSLLRQMNVSSYSSIIGALLFTYAPVRMIRCLGHLNLLSTQWFPLFLLFLLLMFRTGKRRYAFLNGLVLFATFLTSYQYFAMLIILFLGLCVVRLGLFCVEKIAKNKEESSASLSDEVSELRRFLINVLIIGITVTILMGPFLSLIFDELQWEGNYLAEKTATETFPTDFLYFLNLSGRSFLWRSLNLSFNTNDFLGTETMLNPGMIALLLALVAVFSGAKKGIKGRTLLPIMLFSAFFGLLALGSTLHIEGADTGIPLPYALFRVLPFISGVRVPGRFSIVMAFGLAILAAIGTDSLVRQYKRFTWLLMPGIAMLVFFELSWVPLPIQSFENRVFTSQSVKDKIRKKSIHLLSDNISNHSLFQIPFGVENGLRIFGNRVTKDYLLGQVFHNRKIVSGMVARCQDDKIDYFATIPLLQKIDELQKGKFASQYSYTTEFLSRIAYEWAFLNQIDNVIIHKMYGEKPYLRSYEYRIMVNFIKQVFPYIRKEQQVNSEIFHLPRNRYASYTINFSQRPENDVYIANPYLIDWPEKFIKRDYIRMTDQLRILLPMQSQKDVTVAITVRGFQRSGTSEGTILFFLNRQLVASCPYNNTWQVRTIHIKKDFVINGVNILQLQYEPPAVSSADKDDFFPVSIAAVSAGFNYNNEGAARIFVKGKDLSKNQRGLNLICLEAKSGKVMINEVFDICGDEDECNRLSTVIDALEHGTIIVAAVKDDASVSVTPQVHKTFSSFGASVDLKKKFRFAYCVIGKKGWEKGKAIEELNPAVTSIRAGDGELAVKSVTVQSEP